MPGTLDETIDIHCVADFLPHMPEVSGPTALAHRSTRRLTMPRGIWDWAPDDGTDMRAFLLSKVPPRRIARDALLEVEKDEQVASVDTSVVQTNKDIALALTITPEDADGPFDFTLTIDEATAKISDLVQR